MKALKITIIALLAGFSMASCDFLDKEPTKLTPENYFNTPAEANSFLTGVYAILSQPTFYGGDYMYLVAGDDLSHYGGSGRGPASTGLICNNATTSDNAVTAFWYALYSGINRANMFLENIDKVNGFDAGVKEQYIAEARFLRAFYYFNLVECWRRSFQNGFDPKRYQPEHPAYGQAGNLRLHRFRNGRRSRDWSEIGIRPCLQAGTYLPVHRMGHTGTCIYVPCRRALP